MKITVQVNGKPVEIELTADQVQKVKKHTEPIKTFSDACEVLGIRVPKTIHAVDKLKIIAEALNEGWKPDWNNSNQAKFVPWFKWNGTAFVYYDYYDWGSFTLVGSRLCFKDKETAIYAATQFIDLYNDFLQ
jgi:hypothetical protein